MPAGVGGRGILLICHMQKVALRPIRRDDLDQVIALQAASLPVEYDRQRVWDGLFDRYVQHTFVAVGADGTIAGFVLSWDDFIVSLAVAEKYRQRKIGTHLLRLCMNSHFPEHVQLHVSVANIAAQALYFATGFVEKERIPDYYEHPVSDALLLERPKEHAQWFDVPYEINL